MDKTCKCASCTHCEVCRWVDVFKQKGCDFYAVSCGDAVSREAVIDYICERKECYKENCKGKTLRRCPDIMWVHDLPSPQITLKDVEDYCRPRMLKVIAAELFEKMKRSLPPQELKSRWTTEKNSLRIKCMNCKEEYIYDGVSHWEHCPHCRARMV